MTWTHRLGPSDIDEIEIKLSMTPNSHRRHPCRIRNTSVRQADRGCGSARLWGDMTTSVPMPVPAAVKQASVGRLLSMMELIAMTLS